MSDRIALMIGGRIVQEGTPEQIYETPATREISDYLGGCDDLPGRIQDGVFESPVLRFPAPGYPDGDWSARILPGMLRLSLMGDWEITKVSYLGDSRTVKLQKRGCTLTARTELPVTAGMHCGLEISPGNCMLYPIKTNERKQKNNK